MTIEDVLLTGFRILYEEWGGNYRASMKIGPRIPEEGAVYFYSQVSHPSMLVKRLIQEVGFLQYKHLICYILSLRRKEDHVRLVEALGSPTKEHAFFYLEAAYVLAAESWRDFENDPIVLELLISNIAPFWLEKSVSFFLRLLKVSPSQLLPILERLLDHDDPAVRGSVPLFYYGLRCLPASEAQEYSWVISDPEWNRIQAGLETRLRHEADQEVRGLLAREISSIAFQLNRHS